MKAIFLVLIHF